MATDVRLLESVRRFSGRIFGVRTDRVRLPDGRETQLDVVEHRGSVAVIALADGGRIVLVRQYRHPAGRELWEIPAGTLEVGEEPLACARRELREETGYTAARLRPLATFYMTPGFCDERLHLVAARELTEGSQELDGDEAIRVGLFTIDEAKEHVAAGEIADAKTLLALAWWELGRL